ncbi:TolC family protein [Flavobacterium chilense]|uniref:Outer membrane protein, cobalt-zinc-cadmium efflux system n=1 Tax=Flavobacterium chilense TaxID=946677 RepID=A0A1M7FBK9_9FLAO|nr:TolC family protein [Flavobacterium chilense]SHM01037.1 outer membrane protein, cobalt-zinc-cadmium efflux system [Flavobacterium chilense]
MKRILLTLFIIVSCKSVAQTAALNDTIVFSRKQAEALFLEKNISIISEKLNIDIADAQVIQAKLWPNPTLTVSEINLWDNATAQQLPALWGNFGKTQQVNAELEQLVQTAGKRKKMIAMEKVGVDIAKEYFKTFLRNLKIEFRGNLTELQYTQAQEAMYKKQLSSMQTLLKAYSNQVSQGNVGKGEYIRLKASELQFLKEISDLKKENNSLQKELKVLMNLPPTSYIKLTDEGFVPENKNIEDINLGNLMASAVENRPDMKVLKLGNDYNDIKYKYERAVRTPDVTLGISYDRGASLMNDFVGLGFSLDLPFFNRNKGNIKAAKLAVEQGKLATEEKTLTVQSEVLQAYQDLIVTKKLYDTVDATYEGDLDKLLDAYRKNFMQKNTSMLEYLDFVDAYLDNKTILLNSKKDLNNNLEELRYIAGEEIN